MPVSLVRTHLAAACSTDPVSHATYYCCCKGICHIPQTQLTQSRNKHNMRKSNVQEAKVPRKIRYQCLAHLCGPSVRLLQASAFNLGVELPVFRVDARTRGIEEPARRILSVSGLFETRIVSLDRDAGAASSRA